MSALMTEEYLKERTARGKKDSFLRALGKVPDKDPEAYDRF
jgi:hypothetical protein